MLLFNNDIVNTFGDIFSNFNTSNVTIQLTAVFPSVSFQTHFNTSNVTIQLLALVDTPYSDFISIHLMLLFNDRRSNNGYNKVKFQYI